MFSQDPLTFKETVITIIFFMHALETLRRRRIIIIIQRLCMEKSNAKKRYPYNGKLIEIMLDSSLSRFDATVIIKSIPLICRVISMTLIGFSMDSEHRSKDIETFVSINSRR